VPVEGAPNDVEAPKVDPDENGVLVPEPEPNFEPVAELEKLVEAVGKLVEVVEKPVVAGVPNSVAVEFDPNPDEVVLVDVEEEPKSVLGSVAVEPNRLFGSVAVVPGNGLAPPPLLPNDDAPPVPQLVEGVEAGKAVDGGFAGAAALKAASGFVVTTAEDGEEKLNGVAFANWVAISL